jgi:hypothetical protein
MTAEVRIVVKIGKIEVEFEGTNQLFEEKVEPIVKDLIDFGKHNQEASDDDGAAVGHSANRPRAAPFGMTVKSVAAKIGGASGGDLLYAAVVSLAIIKKKETFTRREINDEMKLATGYYKATYTNNLTSYLDGLTKQGVIIETSKDTYAVQEEARKEMEQRLAQ